MNNSVKILLTIQLEGKLGKVQDNVTVIPYCIDTDLQGNPVAEKRGGIKHKSKELQKCTQKINLSQDAYDHMTGPCPEWSKDFIWKKMNPLERVKSHCFRISEGRQFNVEILD